MIDPSGGNGARCARDLERFFPPAIRDLPRWIFWDLVVGKNGRPTKVPRHRASTARPADWSAWRDVPPDSRIGPEGGLGFVLTGGVKIAGKRLVAFDLDACLDPVTHRPVEWVAEILKHLGGSYTEITPSGHGLRVWVLVVDASLSGLRSNAKWRVGADSPPGVQKTAEVQLFGAGPSCYVTVSGQHLEGTSPDILTVPDIGWFVRRCAGASPARPAPETSPASASQALPSPMSPQAPSSEEIVAFIRSDPRGHQLLEAKWESILTGDGQRHYPSSSEAYHRLAWLAYEGARGHVDAAVDVLMRTPWASAGDPRAVRDLPGKYANEAWVAAEVERIARTVEESRAVPQEFAHAEGAAIPGASPFSLFRQVPAEARLVRPCPRRWLLRHPQTGVADGLDLKGGDGVLPIGKVGLLVAAGGVGKTMVMMQLAVSVILGTPFLGYFEVGPAAVGRPVVLVLAEEDDEEVTRRTWAVLDALQVSFENRSRFWDRLYYLALCDHECTLTRPGASPNTFLKTTVCTSWLAEAAALQPALIVFDPLQRFAGGQIDRDNVAATALIASLEAFVVASPLTTCLATHHTSKWGRRENKAESRGASGLTDGARWVMTMRAEGARVLIGMEKSNYSPPWGDVEIACVRGERGDVRVQTPEERARSKTEDLITAQSKLRHSVKRLLVAIAVSAEPITSADKARAAMQQAKSAAVQAIAEATSCAPPMIARGERVGASGARFQLEPLGIAAHFPEAVANGVVDLGLLITDDEAEWSLPFRRRRDESHPGLRLALPKEVPPPGISTGEGASAPM